MKFNTGLVTIKEAIFKTVANIYLIFTLNEPRTKVVDKAPMMLMKADRRPVADMEGVMEEVKELAEAMEPKPQRTKSTRPLKKIKVISQSLTPTAFQRIKPRTKM